MKHLLSLERLDVGRTFALTVGSPSDHRRGTMLEHIVFMLLFMLSSLNVWATDTYTLVTSTSSLSTNDEVILATESAGAPSSGVTGWNGSKDATVGTDASSWVKYQVATVTNGWTLYDASAEKYIQTPTDNWFKYHATTKGTCSVDANGNLVCNSRYLLINGTYYRMYTSIGTKTSFKVWKVTSGGSGNTAVFRRPFKKNFQSGLLYNYKN